MGESPPTQNRNEENIIMIIHKLFVKEQVVPIKKGYIVADVTYKIPYKSGDTAYVNGFALMVNNKAKEYRLLVPSRKYTDSEGITQYNDIFVGNKAVLSSLLDQALKEFKKQAPNHQPQTITETKMQEQHKQAVKDAPVTAAQVADKTEPAVNPNHELKF